MVMNHYEKFQEEHDVNEPCDEVPRRAHNNKSLQEENIVDHVNRRSYQCRSHGSMIKMPEQINYADIS